MSGRITPNGWRWLLYRHLRTRKVCLLIASCSMQTTCQPGFVEAAARALKDEESANVTQKSEIASALQDHQATLPVMPKWEMYD